MSPAQLLWLRRLGIALALAAAFGYFPSFFYRRSGLAHYFRLRAEFEALHAGNLRLREQNLKLRRDLDSLVDPLNEATGGLSEAAVERVARDELGFVRSGEVVFQIERRGP
jgi:cell division protein FtsB